MVIKSYFFKLIIFYLCSTPFKKASYLEIYEPEERVYLTFFNTENYGWTSSKDE